MRIDDTVQLKTGSIDLHVIDFISDEYNLPVEAVLAWENEQGKIDRAAYPLSALRKLKKEKWQ